MNRILLSLLVLSLATPVSAQTSAMKGIESKEGPGITSAIAPSPGPATAPAIPSAATPALTIENRDHARAVKSAKKAKKKAKRSSKHQSLRKP